MKGHCPYCKKEIDETEYIQNSGMCISCYEEECKKSQHPQDIGNAIFHSTHISEHLS